MCGGPSIRIISHFQRSLPKVGLNNAAVHDHLRNSDVNVIDWQVRLAIIESFFWHQDPPCLFGQSWSKIKSTLSLASKWRQCSLFADDSRHADRPLCLVGGVLLGSIFHLRTKKEEGLGICFLCRSMIVWSYNMGMPFISSSIPESWLKIRCKLFLASRATSGASAQSFSASRSSKHNSWNSLFCHLPHFLAFLATSHLEVIQPYNR